MAVDAGGNPSLRGDGHGGKPAGPPDEPLRPQRPREMQDALNFYLYHPLAWQLARRLAKTPLTPNMVSVVGALFVIAAAFSYWGLAWPVGAVLGMVLHMTWHVVDGADGDLARITGRSSPLGEMVDGICDYLSHIVLYVVLAFVLTRSMGAGAAWAWTVAAGLSHIVQSNHVEVQRRFYQYWIYGVPFLHHSRNDAVGLFNQKKGIARLFQVIADLYLRLAAGMTPHLARVDEAVTAAAGNPEKLAAIRAEITAENRPLLLLLKFLGPNPRAIVLGLAMIAGSPLYYFIYQAVVLNGLLVVSVQLHNGAAKRVAARLGAQGLLP
jgi:hypothetical protein